MTLKQLSSRVSYKGNERICHKGCHPPFRVDVMPQVRSFLLKVRVRAIRRVRASQILKKAKGDLREARVRLKCIR